MTAVLARITGPLSRPCPPTVDERTGRRRTDPAGRRQQASRKQNGRKGVAPKRAEGASGFTGDRGVDVRRLTPSDVGALGGDKDLARNSQEFFDALRSKPFPHHRPVVGIRQETVQSMRLENGTVIASEYCFRTHTDGELMRDPDGAPRRFPVGGDGTVHRESASLTRRTVPLALQHGALASGRAARQAVVDFLLEDDHLGPDQADDGLGLTVPDYVVPNAEWTVRITGTDDPSGIDCTVTAVDGGFRREARLDAGDDDVLEADLEVPDAGLYRVTVEADHLPSPLSQLVFAGPGGTTPLDD